MRTVRTSITDAQGHPIPNSKALLWGNNASWLCIKCGEMCGNRTGDSEYRQTCCGVTYEIQRGQNKSGSLDLGPALGVRVV